MISEVHEMVRFEYMCPITQTVMNEPVITYDGHSFEREAILQWFSTGHVTNPLTNLPLNSTQLIPNRALKSLISSFKASASGEMGLTSKMFEIFNAINKAISEQFPSFIDSSGLIKLEDVTELFSTIKKVELKCHAFKTEIEEFKNACKDYLPAFFDGYTLKWKELKKILEQDELMRKKITTLKKQNIILQEELESVEKNKQTFDNLMILSSNPTAFSEVQIEEAWYDEATKTLKDIGMPPTSIFIHITERVQMRLDRSTDWLTKHVNNLEIRKYQMKLVSVTVVSVELYPITYQEKEFSKQLDKELCYYSESFGKALSSDIFNNLERLTFKIQERHSYHSHDIFDGPEMSPLVDSLSKMGSLKQIRILIDPQFNVLHKKYEIEKLVGLKGEGRK